MLVCVNVSNHVCVCMCVCMCVCVCVCVRERERERQRQTDRQRESSTTQYFQVYFSFLLFTQFPVLWDLKPIQLKQTLDIQVACSNFQMSDKYELMAHQHSVEPSYMGKSSQYPAKMALHDRQFVVVGLNLNRVKWQWVRLDLPSFLSCYAEFTV